MALLAEAAEIAVLAARVPVAPARMLAPQHSQCPAARGVPSDRDLPGHARRYRALRLATDGQSGRDSPTQALRQVDRVAALVDRPVPVAPAVANAELGCVHAPAGATPAWRSGSRASHPRVGGAAPSAGWRCRPASRSSRPSSRRGRVTRGRGCGISAYAALRCRHRILDAGISRPGGGALSCHDRRRTYPLRGSVWCGRKLPMHHNHRTRFGRCTAELD